MVRDRPRTVTYVTTLPASRLLYPTPTGGWQPQPLAFLGAAACLAILLFTASSVVIAFLVDLAGAELRLEDSAGMPADPVAVRIAFAVVLVRGVLLAVGVLLLHRLTRSTAPLLADRPWWPVPRSVLIWTVAAYGFVLVYGVVVSALGVDWLTPRGTVGDEVTRDWFTLALAGVVAIVIAPVSEELFFRGALFGALSRFGVMFSAVASGFIFSLPHLDPGSILPFSIVGAIIALVYVRQRSLVAAMQFHVLFNTTSFLLLVLLS